MTNFKIDPASVAFDIDGVFADTMTLFLEIALDEYNIDWVRYDDLTCYMLEECIDIDTPIIKAIIARIIDGNHAAPLKPIAGATEVLTRLGRNYSPILFVTARPHLDSIFKWVRRVLPLDPASIEVIATGSFDAKADVLVDRNISYFVEDRLETCFPLQKAGITPVLFKQPWTENSIRLRKWKAGRSLKR